MKLLYKMSEIIGKYIGHKFKDEEEQEPSLKRISVLP